MVAIHVFLFALSLALSEGTSLVAIVFHVRARPLSPILYREAHRLEKIGGIAWAVTAASGVVIALQEGTSFTSFWLLTSVLLFLCLAINGIIFHARWYRPLILEPPGSQFISVRSKITSFVVSLFIVATIVLLMVDKPLG